VSSRPSFPSDDPVMKRKYKLKMRYRGRLWWAIADTKEKLRLLQQIQAEERQKKEDQY
jgi:hypothetical protein